jgi:hypothetical protein
MTPARGPIGLRLALETPVREYTFRYTQPIILIPCRLVFALSP